MLRCNLVRARQKLQQVYELDPDNPAIIDDPRLPGLSSDQPG
jgi:hypothetical protein